MRNPWNTQNADGIDIGPCRNVVVYDTLVDTGDDGICMKPGRPRVRTEWTVASENVVVADSTVFRAHGGFVIGSETSGGMRHVMVRNVTFVETDIGLRFKSARGRGGVIEKIHVRDVALKDIATGAVVFQTSYGGAAPAEEPEAASPRRRPRPRADALRPCPPDPAVPGLRHREPGLRRGPRGHDDRGPSRGADPPDRLSETSPSARRRERGWSRPRGSGCRTCASCRPGEASTQPHTREFLAAMPEWRRHGLLAFTLNLQGGSPEGYSKGQPWSNPAFHPDGTLREDYAARLKLVLERADELGMVVILGYFYFGQDQQLVDEAAVVRATEGATRWLLDGGWSNVLVEINNECTQSYDHAILKPPRVHELIERVRGIERGGRRLLVSTSYRGGRIPDESVVRASDFLLHGGEALTQSHPRDLVVE